MSIIFFTDALISQRPAHYRGADVSASPRKNWIPFKYQGTREVLAVMGVPGRTSTDQMGW